MSTKLNPYINLLGNAREALEFYKNIFGGTVTINTFKESGMVPEPSMADQVMHGQLVADNGITLMISDARPDMAHPVSSNISISVTGEDEVELKSYWDGLSNGGTITVPFAKAPWGDTFGMVTDKFGTEWLVDVTVKK